MTIVVKSAIAPIRNGGPPTKTAISQAVNRPESSRIRMLRNPIAVPLRST
jgi:hypothetical protein